MGARSAISVVDHPWPVVYQAMRQCLPAAGYRILTAEPERGRLAVRRGNTRLTLSVGAVDPVTTAWVADAELRFGLLRPRHAHHFTMVSEALDRYLAAYYA